MQSDILAYPFPILKVQLTVGEQLLAEKGALLAYRGELDWATKVEARAFKHFALKLFGKSLTYNVFTAKTQAELTLAPTGAGDLLEIKLQPENAYFIAPGSHLARYGDLHFDFKIDGKAILGDNLRTMKVWGDGSIFVVTYGALQRHDLTAGEKLVVDDGFLVAMEQSVQYRVMPVSLKRTLVSGEGLMIELIGPGKVYLQSRRKPQGKKSSGVGDVVQAVGG